MPLIAARTSLRPELETEPETYERQKLQSRLSGIRVLLVDDDADTLDLLGAALTQASAVVTTATSAGDAIQAFGVAEFDVIVSDIAMPGEDGYQLIQRIRKSGFDRGTIPAVAITAYAKDEDREKAFSAGYQSFLAKPIELSDLVTAITAAVASTGY